MNEEMRKALKKVEDAPTITEVEENGYCMFCESYTDKDTNARTEIVIYGLEPKTYLAKYVDGENIVFRDITAVQVQEEEPENDTKNMYYKCYKAEAYSYIDKNFATIAEVKSFLKVDDISFKATNYGLAAKVNGWDVTVELGKMENEGEGYVSMVEESGALEDLYEDSYYDYD